MFAKPTKSARPLAHSGARSGVPKFALAGGSRIPKNAFPKTARLLKHPSFQRVYDTGRKHFSASMIFFYLLHEGAPPSSPSCGDRVGINVQIGLTVGRAIGGAVDRNRIKRRMRDVVRHELATLHDALTIRGISAEIVINPKKSTLTADLAKLRAEVARGFSVIAAAGAAQAEGAPSGR